MRTQSYVELLARHLAGHERFRHALSGPRLGMVVKAAPLHDIGKVGVPDAILLKPGRLTVKRIPGCHEGTHIGADAINKAMEQALAALTTRPPNRPRGPLPSCTSRGRYPSVTMKNGTAAVTGRTGGRCDYPSRRV